MQRPYGSLEIHIIGYMIPRYVYFTVWDPRSLPAGVDGFDKSYDSVLRKSTGKMHPSFIVKADRVPSSYMGSFHH